jgi:hypothetical protein
MPNAQQAVDAAIKEVKRLGILLSKNKNKQIESGDERSSIKATCLSWFNSHRPAVVLALGSSIIIEIDADYKSLLALSEKRPIRIGVVSHIKALKKRLVTIHSEKVLELGATASSKSSSDAVPDFSKLASDPKMQEILERRWKECTECLDARVPLAAIVMMGGLLEGLLLARVNQEANLAPIFTAATAPRDKKTSKTFPLKEWGLKDFISVAHELSWISLSAKDVGEVLRDYRNYIHPQKEFSHGVSLHADDAVVLWEITKSISRQLLK